LKHAGTAGSRIAGRLPARSCHRPRRRAGRRGLVLGAEDVRSASHRSQRPGDHRGGSARQVPGPCHRPGPSSAHAPRPGRLATLAGQLRVRRKNVKDMLRVKLFIAGIGNAYSDEVLHAARMSPFKIAASMTRDEVATLYDAIKTTLSEAVERSAGLAAADLKGEKKSGLRVHGRAGQECAVCGDTIKEVSFADSSLQYCPTCQTGG